jgi:hypothetical protein
MTRKRCAQQRQSKSASRQTDLRVGIGREIRRRNVGLGRLVDFLAGDYAVAFRFVAFHFLRCSEIFLQVQYYVAGQVTFASHPTPDQEEALRCFGQHRRALFRRR